ncbi:MAG: polysaccharide biosynthesis protein [Anaerolineae bacterium]|nr:polysaccharide biosynthesis protein [Anaerolineae bacterium]
MTRLFKQFWKLRSSNYVNIKFILDTALWTLAAPLAFLLRLEENFGTFLQAAIVYTIVGAVIKAVVIKYYGLHRQSWHKVGVKDLYRIICVVGLTALVSLALASLVNPILRIPRSVPLIDGGLGLLTLSFARLATRLGYEQSALAQSNRPSRRILIIGAGEAGTLIAREMIRHPEAGLRPIGFLDDEPSKRRESYLGLPVLGVIDDLPKIIKVNQIDEVLIAMPSISGAAIRRIIDIARQAKSPYRIIPGVFDILSGHVSLSNIREVRVEDLLRREPVQLNLEEIAAYLQDRVVLVTGACGSIGSEIVRQVLTYKPKHLVLLDRNENAVYLLERELQNSHPQACFSTIIGDVRRRDKLDRIFQAHRPNVVFHAAAYKHVPLMEAHPDEAILNNVGGTRNLLDMALAYNVERLVNISTDKAVNPTSIMGSSKRIAEYLVEQAAEKTGPGQSFVSVRFGNVLDSNGSVVPIFKEQIRRGGPVTVTHPDMTRYFMSIPEATQLVLQAAGLGESKAIYILDMGEPVKIVDLARDMIRLSGFEPEVDIPIQFMGKRPGEKLFEELRAAEPGTTETKYDKILVLHKNGANQQDFVSQLEALMSAGQSGNHVEIRSLIKQMIPSYQPNSEQLEADEEIFRV